MCQKLWYYTLGYTILLLNTKLLGGGGWGGGWGVYVHLCIERDSFISIANLAYQFVSEKYIPCC